MEWKPFVSSLLGVLTVVALHTEQAAKLTKGGKNMAPVLFGSILIVQVMFEILSKYYGKTCEFVDGTFTAMIVVGAYFLIDMLLKGKVGKMSGLTSGVGMGASSFGAQPGFGQAASAGSSQGLGYILALAAGIGGALWLWKTWLKPKVMPTQCSASEACPSCPPCPPCAPSATEERIVISSPDNKDAFVSY